MILWTSSEAFSRSFRHTRHARYALDEQKYYKRRAQTLTKRKSRNRLQFYGRATLRMTLKATTFHRLMAPLSHCHTATITMFVVHECTCNIILFIDYCLRLFAGSVNVIWNINSGKEVAFSVIVREEAITVASPYYIKGIFFVECI